MHPLEPSPEVLVRTPETTANIDCFCSEGISESNIYPGDVGASPSEDLGSDVVRSNAEPADKMMTTMTRRSDAGRRASRSHRISSKTTAHSAPHPVKPPSRSTIPNIPMDLNLTTESAPSQIFNFSCEDVNENCVRVVLYPAHYDRSALRWEYRVPLSVVCQLNLQKSL